MAASGAQVDAAAAASMISGYRKNNGLGAVTVDPTLMKLAAEQAHAMASRDRLDHDVGRGFNQRIAGSGYDAKAAYENIGAGYHTLAEAFSGWRGSPGHRANMLQRDVTQIGIAAAYAPRSKYKVFWALILASPDEPAARDRRAQRRAGLVGIVVAAEHAGDAAFENAPVARARFQVDRSDGRAP